MSEGSWCREADVRPDPSLSETGRQIVSDHRVLIHDGLTINIHSFLVINNKHYRHDRRSTPRLRSSWYLFIFLFKEIQELSWCVLQRILYLVHAVETEVWFFSCCLVINWIDILILLFLNSHWSSFQAKDKHWRVCGPDQLSLTHDQVHFLHIQSM